MAVWSDLYDDVLPELPGCTPALAERAIRDTVIDFMVRSEIERRTITGVDHPGGASPISLPGLAATGEMIVHVLAVFFDDVPLKQISVKEAKPTWMSDLGTPKEYLIEGNNLWLIPSPANPATDAVKIRVSTAPTPSATSFPDIVYTLYREELAIGAKARLLAKPNKPWTDQGLAAAYLQIYSRAVDAASVASGRGGRNVPMRGKATFY